MHPKLPEGPKGCPLAGFEDQQLPDHFRVAAVPGSSAAAYLRRPAKTA
jgi:hypothetical protein